MTTLKRSLLAMIVVGLSASSALASPVTIHVGAYEGRYYINGVGGPYFGDQTVDLAPGTYTLDTGANINGSALAFDVDGSGTISGVTPTGAAMANGATVTFNTATIAIDAGNYLGRYFLSSYGTAVELHGSQSVALLPGLTYTLDNGAEAAMLAEASDFTFSLDAIGRVSTSSPAALADGTSSTLSLVTVPIQINPQAYAGAYFVASFYPTSFTGTQTFNVLPGLLYTVDDGAEIGGSAFAIFVDGSGQVSTTSDAGSGAGSVLTLANLIVHVDATACGGSYSRGPYKELTGPADVGLIPSLAVVITTAEGSAVIAPALGPVAVPSLSCVTITGSQIVTPRQTKTNLLAQLSALRATVTDRIAGRTLDDAIANVTASLDSRLWGADGTHLNVQSGAAVFDLEERAAVDLGLLIVFTRPGVDAIVLRTLITGFANVDRQLASTAIDDAGSRPIGDARTDLAQGDADLAHGHATSAFDHYRDAWQDAVRVHHGGDGHRHDYGCGHGRGAGR